LIAAYLPLLQAGWRQSVIQVSLAVLLLALFFGLARLENRYHHAERLRDRLYLLGRDRRIVALALATALATGVEITSINILTTFLVELRGFTHMASTIGLIVYLVGIAGGRLLVGFFTRKSQLVPYMLSMFGLALLFFSGLFFLPWGRAIYVIIFLSGLALSAILPLIISLAGLLYQEMAGTAMGVIKTAIPVGGILLPFLMSMLAQYLSFQVSLLLLPLALLFALAILYSQNRASSTSKIKAG
jgi:fucose permease